MIKAHKGLEMVAATVIEGNMRSTKIKRQIAGSGPAPVPGTLHPKLSKISS